MNIELLFVSSNIKAYDSLSDHLSSLHLSSLPYSYQTSSHLTFPELVFPIQILFK
jgi:hypothetical protein